MFDTRFFTRRGSILVSLITESRIKKDILTKRGLGF